MKLNGSALFIIFLVTQSVAILTVAKEFDFFYFVQQWPGSYCDSRRGCCYPKTGKPAEDFSIHGLWPNYIDGSYPSNCDSSNPFDDSKESHGIKPADGVFHTMGQIKDAITKAVGYEPFIECNVDSVGNHHIYQVYQCVDALGSNFIKCPVLPHGRACGNKVEFPSFSSASSRDEL